MECTVLAGAQLATNLKAVGLFVMDSMFFVVDHARPVTITDSFFL